jgi:mannose-1-phosphate guanylyltransferase
MSGKHPVETTASPVYAVILAGGQGTRLWPLSRQATPKQFLELSPSGQSGRNSLLQEAVRRASILCGEENRCGKENRGTNASHVLVITTAQHARLVR